MNNFLKRNREVIDYGAMIPAAMVPAVAQLLFRPNPTGAWMLAGIAIFLVVAQTVCAVIKWKMDKDDRLLTD